MVAVNLTILKQLTTYVSCVTSRPREQLTLVYPLSFSAHSIQFIDLKANETFVNRLFININHNVIRSVKKMIGGKYLKTDNKVHLRPSFISLH